MVRALDAFSVLCVANALFIPHDLPGFRGIVKGGGNPPELKDPDISGIVSGKHNVRMPCDRYQKGGQRSPHRGMPQRDPDLHTSGPHETVPVFEDPDEEFKRPVSFSPNGVFISASAEPFAIEDQFIVVFDENADDALINQHFVSLERTIAAHVNTLAAQNDQLVLNGINFGVLHKYNIGSAFRAYSARFYQPIAEEVAKMPGIKFVEKDSKVHTLKPARERNAPWGLARISHRKRLSLGSFNRYLYDNDAGEGVTAYVIDTGIYTKHNDFEGRAVWGKTIPLDDVDEDTHGHGTHCAGVIAGKLYGIAKKAKVVAVKTLGSDGSGSMSDVIAGVEYALNSHVKESKENPKHKGSTANMSLGGGKSPSLDLAVNAAVRNGLHFAVAAGNENQDACDVSPAGATGPITVGATTLADERAYFSNWGSCVDIFAPGMNILSCGIENPDSTEVMSGTSMASPHVCGLMAYFLSLQPSQDSEYAVRRAITPKELKSNIIAFGSQGFLSDVGENSPNVIAFNGGGESLAGFWNNNGSSDSVNGNLEFAHLMDELSAKVSTLSRTLAEMLEESMNFAGDFLRETLSNFAGETSDSFRSVTQKSEEMLHKVLVNGNTAKQMIDHELAELRGI